MTRFNTGYGNKTGTTFKSGNINNTGMRKITGIEFKSGHRYVSGKINKAG